MVRDRGGGFWRMRGGSTVLCFVVAVVLSARGVYAAQLSTAAVHQDDDFDPCLGLCHGNRECVLAGNGGAFCVECGGFMKFNLASREYEDCCQYDVELKKCKTALKSSSMGKCKRRNDLFAKVSDCGMMRASFRKPSGYACHSPRDYYRNGLACKIMTYEGVTSCVNHDRSTDETCPRFRPVGKPVNGENALDWLTSVSISADGSRMIVGASFNSERDRESGHARVFDYFEDVGWVQLGEDIFGESEGDRSGFSVAISADGTKLAVGAISSDGVNGLLSGHVRVFEYLEPAGWVQVGQDIDGAEALDVFGYSVAMSSDGTRLAAGAIFSSSDDAFFSGQVRAFELQGDTWVQMGEDIDGEEELDSVGYSVAMSADGSRVAVPGYTNDANGPDSGHVRIFEFVEGSGWVILGEEIPGDRPDDRLGWEVALSADGNRVAVSSTEPRSLTGYVRVYDYKAGEGWVKVGQDIYGEAVFDFSGWNVDMSADGNIMAIGAVFNAGNGSSSGHTRVYKWDGCKWVQVGMDLDGEESGDASGWTVSLSSSGHRLAVAEPFSDPNGVTSGRVRVFDIVDPCRYPVRGPPRPRRK